MKINEILNEDDYYPPDPDEARRADVAEREKRLTEFIDNYIEEYLGAPHRGGVWRHAGMMKIYMSIPQNKPDRNPRRRDPNAVKSREQNMKQDWRETANEIIEELRRLELGEFELSILSPYKIELEEMSALYETTTAGGIATVVGGLAPAITRNASIYGNAPKAKKKKKKKYANSKD